MPRKQLTAKEAKAEIYNDNTCRFMCQGCSQIYFIQMMPHYSGLCALCWPDNDALRYWRWFWQEQFAAAVAANNFSFSTRSAAYRAVQLIEWTMDADNFCNRQPRLKVIYAALKNPYVLGYRDLDAREKKKRVAYGEWAKQIVPKLVDMWKLYESQPEPVEDCKQLKLF